LAREDGTLYIKRLAGETKTYGLIGHETLGSERVFKYRLKDTYNGLMPYEMNGKWGYKLADGTVKIAPVFEYARIFDQGIGKVKTDGKWGLINEDGKRLTPTAYDYIGHLLDGKMEAMYEGFKGYIGSKDMRFNPYSWIDNHR